MGRASESFAIPQANRQIPITYSSLSLSIEQKVCFQGKLLNGFWKIELGCLGILKLEENVYVLTMEQRETVSYFCFIIMPGLAKRVFTFICAHVTAG